ncbi:MAG TPA: hypothetical protein VGB03_06370 [Acidimicrobiales bacterium]
MDLSKVLGDVYADNESTTGRAVPEWADDAHLDEAFASWTPGPPPEAPAAEHEMAAHVDLGSRRRIDDDLAVALTQALTAAPAPAAVVVEPQPSLDNTSDDLVGELLLEPVAEPEPARGWTRGDDDVLPNRGGRSSRSLRFSRR